MKVQDKEEKEDETKSIDSEQKIKKDTVEKDDDSESDLEDEHFSVEKKDEEESLISSENKNNYAKDTSNENTEMSVSDDGYDNETTEGKHKIGEEAKSDIYNEKDNKESQEIMDDRAHNKINTKTKEVNAGTCDSNEAELTKESEIETFMEVDEGMEESSSGIYKKDTVIEEGSLKNLEKENEVNVKPIETKEEEESDPTAKSIKVDEEIKEISSENDKKKSTIEEGSVLNTEEGKKGSENEKSTEPKEESKSIKHIDIDGENENGTDGEQNNENTGGQVDDEYEQSTIETEQNSEIKEQHNNNVSEKEHVAAKTADESIEEVSAKEEE